MSSRGTEPAEWRGDLSYCPFATFNSGSRLMAKIASPVNRRGTSGRLATDDIGWEWILTTPWANVSLFVTWLCHVMQSRRLCLHLRYRSIPRAGGDLPFSFSMINDYRPQTTDHRLPTTDYWLNKLVGMTFSMTTRLTITIVYWSLIIVHWNRFAGTHSLAPYPFRWKRVRGNS